MSDPTIVFETSDYMIINKPAGWVVNDASTVTHDLVIQRWLDSLKNNPLANNREYRSGIVHRLDKETSGALIVAKHSNSFEALQRQFKERIVKKRYIALVHGILKENSGEIDAPVGRLPWRRDRFGVYQNGREAFTSYKVRNEYEKDSQKYSLIEFYPRTGRTHQIRVHAKHLGHPLVSDEFYAGRKRSRNDRVWCPRLFLHANWISFINPETGEQVEYEVPLADDLRAALDTLNLLD